MKNSAWYHKLWLTKLNDLPLKDDENTAWADMEQMLDQQLPVSNSAAGTPAPKPAGTTLGSYLGYIASAAAMIGAAAYFIVNPPEQDKVSKVIKDKAAMQIAPDKTNSDSVSADTLSFKNLAPALVDSHLADSSTSSTPVLKTSILVKSASLINAKQYEGGIKNPESDDRIKTSDDLIATTNIGIEINVLDSTHRGEKPSLNNMDSQIPARELPADLSDIDDSPLKQKRQKRSSKAKTPINTPQYNFVIETGLNRANDGNTLYFGAFGTYALSSRWLVNIGLRMNTQRSFTGNYTRKSYFRPDSMPEFSFTDQRKVLVMDIPLTATYKLSNTISINAAPMISLPLKQSGIKLGPIKQTTDTLMNTKVIYGILNNTKMNRVNFGFSTGFSLHLWQFDINARYQVLSPYSFNNEFGDNKFNSRSFQVGIGYRFKQ